MSAANIHRFGSTDRTLTGSAELYGVKLQRASKPQDTSRQKIRALFRRSRCCLNTLGKEMKRGVQEMDEIGPGTTDQYGNQQVRIVAAHEVVVRPDKVSLL